MAEAAKAPKRPQGRSRGPNASRRLQLALGGGPRTDEFTTLLEHTVDAFSANDDSAVEDVRRILADIRKQYDDVHYEAEQKERELQRLREAIRVADSAGNNKTDDLYRLDDARKDLQK